MKKIILTALILFAVLPCLVSFDVATVRLAVDDGMLTDTEYVELETALQRASSESGVEIYALVYDALNNGGRELTERQMASRLGVDISSDNAIVLTVVKIGGSYYYELFTYGESYGLISDADADRILDDTDVRSIKRGDIATGVAAYADVSASLASANRNGRWITLTVVSLIVAVLAGGGTVLGVFIAYKKKQKSPSYPLSQYARLELMHADDDFLGSNVTRVRINTSSGGGGRGGGGSRGGSRGRR